MESFKISDLVSDRAMREALDDEMFEPMCDYEDVLDSMAVEFDDSEDCV